MKNIMLIISLLLISAEPAVCQLSGSFSGIVENRFVQSGMSAENAHTLALAMQQAGFSEDQAEKFSLRLTAVNLPAMAVEAVREKVLEGIAKRIAPERIMQAVTRVEDRYAYADQLTAGIRQDQRMQLAQDYADSLAAGLSRDDAARIAAAIGSEKRSSAKQLQFSLQKETLLTVRDMVRQGISSSTTAAIIGEALAGGYDAAGMRILRSSLRNGQRDNLEETALKYRAAIGSGVAAESLESYAGSGNQNQGFQGSTSSGAGRANDSGNGAGSGKSSSGGSADNGGSASSSGNGGSAGSSSDSGGGSGAGSGSSGSGSSGNSSGSGTGSGSADSGSSGSSSSGSGAGSGSSSGGSSGSGSSGSAGSSSGSGSSGSGNGSGGAGNGGGNEGNR